MCEPDTRIFTDHRNVLIVFAPSGLGPILGRHKVLKVLRWDVYLSQFMYRIENIEEDDIVIADIMTPWLRGYRDSNKAIKRVDDILRHVMVPSPSD